MASDAGRNSGPDTVPSDPDVELIVRLAAGDPSAARTLMERRLPRILGLARRMLNDPVEAEDVAQETFLRVWKAADRWRPGEAKVETWMSRIAINLCYDRLRKRRETLMETLPERPSTDAPADAMIGAGETAQVVLAALNTLPDRQRLAMELCHYQEMGNIEAAEVMDISVEALESLLSRARRKLRETLARQADELMSGFAALSGEG
ncbi:RNA polymerase sigma factor [Hyphobacterium marinum]|uniref:RNA polymerase sigma factor n=1 Tax=Hyphobacterium marinum TaxID=3116574 RepID=A0ABU7M0F6_9PROT|nr:RNA polymerase sigma factor [Hyphobacterium sp. Y6023]MEE2567304.1 RNA polymerase sigma factor [Hyphobacterium sp. Y6023]